MSIVLYIFAIFLHHVSGGFTESQCLLFELEATDMHGHNFMGWEYRYDSCKQYLLGIVKLLLKMVLNLVFKNLSGSMQLLLLNNISVSIHTQLAVMYTIWAS